MLNGATFYLFSDHQEFIWYPAVNEANKLAPLCDVLHPLQLAVTPGNPRDASHRSGATAPQMIL
jgi:hypothetical protein